MIRDGAALAVALFGKPLDPRAYLLGFYPQAAIPPLDHVVRTAVPLVAEISNGIWIARCPCGAPGLPAPGCVVWFDRPLAWCIRCQNAGVGRGWRPMALPSPEQRTAIEALLACRPNEHDRNWTPSESLADLVAQNREHGDGIPRRARVGLWARRAAALGGIG